MKLNEKEQGFVFDQIIEELAKDTELPVDMIMEMVQKEYRVDDDYMKKCLQTQKSKFVANNCVIGFIGGKEIKRTTGLSHVNAILKRVRTKLFKLMPYRELNNDELDVMIECIRSKAWGGIKNETRV